MVIFGWMKRPTQLGTKIDECLACGLIGPHALIRRAYWVHVFWLPILFVGFSHGMACSRCGAWTGVPWMTMRRGFKNGRLPLDRVRANFTALEPDDWGRRPRAEAVLDPIQVNPKRGAWDLYLKVWPVVFAVVIVAAVILRPTTPSGASVDRNLESQYGAAHDCWKDEKGGVVGCRLALGEVVGEQTSRRVTCYFGEPLDENVQSLRCEN